MSKQEPILTVGDLRKALEGVADDTPLAKRDFGTSWKNGFDNVDLIELVTLGKGVGSMTVRSDDEFNRTYQGPKSNPFKAVAFD